MVSCITASNLSLVRSRDPLTRIFSQPHPSQSLASYYSCFFCSLSYNSKVPILSELDFNFLLIQRGNKLVYQKKKKFDFNGIRSLPSYLWILERKPTKVENGRKEWRKIILCCSQFSTDSMIFRKRMASFHVVLLLQFEYDHLHNNF